MKITLEKTKKGYSINISKKDINCTFDGIKQDEMENLKEEIERVLNEAPKSTIRVWNPRSRRHDIIEQ